MTRPLVSWSFSRWQTYDLCPLKFKLVNLDKLDQGPKNPAMERGNTIHQLADQYVNGTLARLPAELAKVKNDLVAARKQKKLAPSTLAVEETWAFTSAWTPTTYDDWAGCWLRIKVDRAEIVAGTNIVKITDYKTGQYRPQQQQDYQLQLDLYALGALHVYHQMPDLLVRPRLLYTDHGIEWPSSNDVITYTPADLPRLKKTWVNRVKPMFADKRFAPKPNWTCRYCNFRKDNGGPCQH